MFIVKCMLLTFIFNYSARLWRFYIVAIFHVSFLLQSWIPHSFLMYQVDIYAAHTSHSIQTHKHTLEEKSLTRKEEKQKTENIKKSCSSHAREYPLRELAESHDRRRFFTENMAAIREPVLVVSIIGCFDIGKKGKFSDESHSTLRSFPFNFRVQSLPETSWQLRRNFVFLRKTFSSFSTLAISSQKQHKNGFYDSSA